MKRNLPLSTIYDPFTDIEDAPDDRRRKRQRFGLGTTQWRFTDRTPSPEKGDGSSESSFSPSGLSSTPTKRARDAELSSVDADLLSTGADPVEKEVILSGNQPQVTETSQNDQPISPPHGLHDLNDENLEKRTQDAATAQLEQNTVILESQTVGDQPTDVEPYAQITRSPGSLNSEPRQMEVVQSVSPSPRISSPIRIEAIVIDEVVDDDQSQPLPTHRPPDFGLDGAGISREQQVTSDLAFDDVGEKWGQAQHLWQQADDLPHEQPPLTDFLALQHSEVIGDEFDGPASPGVPQAQSFAESEFSSLEQAAQKQPDVLVPLQTDSAVSYQLPTSDKHDQDAEVLHHTLEERGEKTSSGLEGNGDEGITYPLLETVDHNQYAGQLLTTEAQKPDSSEDPILDSTSQQEIEVIDLGSSDDEDSAQPVSIEIPAPAADSLHSIDLLAHPSFQEAHDESVIEDIEQDAQHGQNLIPVEEISTPSDNLLGLEDDYLAPPKREETSPERSEDRGFVEAQKTYINYPAAEDLSADQQPSISQLPSTVPESVEKLPENVSFEILESQHESALTAPSTEAPNSERDAENSQAPPLTQETSAGLLAPDSPTKSATKDELSQIPGADPIADQDMPKESNQSSGEKLPVAVESSEERHPEAESDAQKVAESGHVSSPPQPRESSLVRRLKEQRRKSSLRSASHLSRPSTASPWFAPRKSSPSGDDEKLQVNTETTVLSSPISERYATLPGSPSRESQVSKSMLHSPTPAAPQQPLPSSPPYQPSSQPATGFRTNLSYFVPLASLHCHYGTEVDILAVVTATTPIVKAESGPKDFVQTISLIDPSSYPTTERKSRATTSAQLLRPRKTSLPRTVAGDAILLRNFKVQSFQNRLGLLSTESSSWAVFREDADVQIRGPPVEFGPEERAFARAHWKWWDSINLEDRASLSGQKEEDEAVKFAKGPSQKSRKKGVGFDIPPSASVRKRAKNRDAKSAPDMEAQTNEGHLDERSLGLDGSNEQKEDVKTPSKPSGSGRALRSRTKQDSAPSSPEKHFSKPVIEDPPVHELRDGTKYVDGNEDTNAEKKSRVARKPRDEVHELRDGTKYVDEDPEAYQEDKSTAAKGGQKGVHQLRDGRTYPERG